MTSQRIFYKENVETERSASREKRPATAGSTQEKEGPATELTLDEVLEILNLIEKSDFDFLQLEVGDLKLTVSKGGPAGISGDSRSTVTLSNPAASSSPTFGADAREAQAPRQQPEAKAKQIAVKEGTVPVAAPMVGKFYTTPEPGAPPFVELGKQVDEDATVGLIEVMKVFNAVKSGVRGVIDEVCVQNGEFVEYGQTLFLVRPDPLSRKKGPSA